MTIQRFKKAAAIAATLALFPIAGQASIDSPYGGANFYEPFGGLGLNTPMGGANINTPFGGFGLNTPFGGASVNTPFGGFGLNTPFGGANVSTPFGGFGLNTPFGGVNLAGFGLNTPFGGANVSTPFGGFGLNTPFGGVNVAGFNLHGGGAAGAPASGHSSAVRCSFGSELLLASTVDSCENSGGKVDPALLSYRIPCNVGGSVVMAPSQAVCARLDGKPAQ